MDLPPLSRQPPKPKKPSKEAVDVSLKLVAHFCSAAPDHNIFSDMTTATTYAAACRCLRNYLEA